jgi:hypothetical protein
MAGQSLDSGTQCQRNTWKSEDVSELRNGSTRTRLHQKKLIAPSSDIRFSCFLGWLEVQASMIFNGRSKFGFWNSVPENCLKKWRCVWTEVRTGLTTTRLHYKKLIAPSFWVESKRKRANYSMVGGNLNSGSSGQRNARKSEEVSELRNGPTTTSLHQKKLIAPSCDIRFSSFFGWIEAQESKLFNGSRKLPSGNDGQTNT